MLIRNKIAGLLIIFGMFFSCLAMAQDLSVGAKDKGLSIQEKIDQRRMDIQDLTLRMLYAQSETHKRKLIQNNNKELKVKVVQNEKIIEELGQQVEQKKQLEKDFKNLLGSIPLRISEAQEPLKKKIDDLTSQLDASQKSIPVKVLEAQEPLKKKIAELNTQWLESQKTVDQVRADIKNKIEDISVKQKEINELKKKVEELSDQLSLTKKSVERSEVELKTLQKNSDQKEKQLDKTRKLLDQEGAYREQLRQDWSKERQELQDKCAKLEQELKQFKQAKK